MVRHRTARGSARSCAEGLSLEEVRNMLRAPVQVALVALATVMGLASSVEAAEHPSPPSPEKRAESLQEPLRTVHLSLAQSLHDSQVQEWDGVATEEQGWREKALAGVALALEEYYVMELSYPESVHQLLDSGYLDAAAPTKVELLDFTPDASRADDLTLIYIPQPIGRTTLITAPGKGCGDTLRSYREYCLAVPEAHIQVWIGDGKLRNTNWMEPFYNFGVHDILRINQENPGASSCASCS